MITFKKLISIIICVALVISMTSCKKLFSLYNSSNLSASDITYESDASSIFASGSDTILKSSKAQKSSSNIASSNKATTSSPIILNSNDVEINAKTTSNKVSFISSNNIYTPVSESNYYNYACLSNSLKYAYNQIKSAAETRTTGLINLGNVTEKEIMLVYQAVKNDYPEYFWLPASYVIKMLNQNDYGIAFEYTSESVAVSYLCTDTQRTVMSYKLKSKILEITKALNNFTNGKSGSQYQIELFIHDYMCQNVKYDNAAAENSSSNPYAFTAYGALVEGNAVCEGYSRAFQLLLNMYGIRNTLISGYSSENVPHLWNGVYINNKWYNTDLTYDDNGSNATHGYFNISDSIILRDREADRNFNVFSNIENSFNINKPICNSDSDGYIKLNGCQFSKGCDYQKIMSDKVAEASQNGLSYCEFIFDSTYTDSEAKKYLDGINIASILSAAGKITGKKVTFNGSQTFTTKISYLYLAFK